MSKKGNNKRKQKKGLYSVVAILVALSFISFSVFNSKPNKVKKANPNIAPLYAQARDIPFKQEGSLAILDADKKVFEARIELAETVKERADGLMFRKHMPKDAGMLFLFENSEPRSFWMKNTYLSLDILYINVNKEVVQIYHNAQPLSKKSLVCEHDVAYVLELNGGVCKEIGITERMHISYEIN